MQDGTGTAIDECMSLGAAALGIWTIKDALHLMLHIITVASVSELTGCQPGYINW